MNAVTLAGNLGAAPDIRFTTRGKKVAALRVAVEDRFKVGDDWSSSTDWFSIVAWGRLADVAEGFASGDRVIVAGKLKTRSWEDQRTGGRRTTVEVVAFSIGLQPSSRSAAESGSQVAPAAPGPSTRPPPADDPGYFDDDVPF